MFKNLFIFAPQKIPELSFVEIILTVSSSFFRGILLLAVSTIWLGVNAQTQDSAKPFYCAIKSNMLYDAALVPNLGAEFYVGSNLSLGANWMYSWWSKKSSHRYWRIYGGDLNARYWFGPAAKRKPLTGHHAGIYAGIVTFDFEWGGTAYMGGQPGKNIWHRAWLNVGIEYGYSLPVSRHFNIDFTLGVGYLGGTLEKFKPVEGDYLWESTSRHKWFGPTKAEISIVWLLGRGNVNENKGAGR